MTMPLVRFLPVPPPLDGLRLDQFLARMIPGASREEREEQMARGVEDSQGLALVRGSLLRAGETVGLRISPRLHASLLDLPVLYDDPCLLGLDKPVGVLTHPVASGEGRGDTVVDFALSRIRPLGLHSGLIHRLDRETSGVILITKGKRSQRTLARAFQRRRVVKIYVAVVAGRVVRAEGSIHEPLASPQGGMLEAHTDYRVLERHGGSTLVALRPHTGRNHQLRIHMASLGHPLLGDATTGGPPAPRLGLHALALGVVHPCRRTPLLIRSFPPAGFLSLLGEGAGDCSLWQRDMEDWLGEPR